MADLTVYLNAPPHQFFGGVAASPQSAPVGTVQVGDHFYLLDTASDRHRVVSVPVMRPQQDTSQRPGEQTLTAEALWRRTLSSFIHGAGQDWYDRDDGDPLRFRASRGVNVWKDWQLSMLPDTTLVTTDASGWRSMVPRKQAGVSHLIATGFNGIAKSITTAQAVTTITGLTGNVWAASTGNDVYLTAALGIFLLNAAASGVTSFNANITAADRIFFVHNRLIVFKGAQLFDLIDGTTTTPHTTLRTGWTWTSACEGDGTIYAGGFNGDTGQVYSIPVKPDGTGLDAARVALTLPDGEEVHALASYLGFVVIGTNKGVRLAQPQTPHSLVMGPLVAGGPVRCLEPQEEFVWFGWDNMFPDRAGLGRIDLTRFVDALGPAYATDIVGLQAGNVGAAATFDNRRWVAVGTGVYRQSDTLINQGYIETGNITFNVSDDKTAVFADVRTLPLPVGDSIVVEARDPHLAYQVVGTMNQPEQERPLIEFTMDHDRAVFHELKVTLNRGSATGPTLTAVTLAVQVSPDRALNIFLPVLIHRTVNVAGQDYLMDLKAEYDYLADLAATQRLIRFVSGAMTYLCVVEDFEWAPYETDAAGDFRDGTMVLKLKTVEILR